MINDKWSEPHLSFSKATHLSFSEAQRRPAALRAYIEGVETMTKAEVLL